MTGTLWKLSYLHVPDGCNLIAGRLVSVLESSTSNEASPVLDRRLHPIK